MDVVNESLGYPDDLRRLAVVERALARGCIAGGLVASIDWASATSRMGVQWTELTVTLAISMPFGAALGLALTPLLGLDGYWPRPRLNYERWEAAVLSTLTLVPLASFGLRAYALDFSSRAWLLPLLPLFWFLFWRFLSSRAAGLLGPVAFLLGTGFTWLVASSLKLAERAGQQWLEPSAFLFAFTPLLIVTLAQAFTLLVRSLGGSLTSPALRSLSLALGASVALAATRGNVSSYTTLRLAATAVAFVFIGLGLPSLDKLLPARRVGVLLGVALASGAAAAVLLAPTSPVFWNLSHAHVLTRELGSLVRLFPDGARDRSTHLRTRPEFGLGRAWARGAHPQSLPVLEPRTRSVLLVTIDALRFDHVGYSGRQRQPLTPEFDTFARKAQRFTRAYSASSSTAPSMSALLWGRPANTIRFQPISGSRERLFAVDEFPSNERLFFTTVDPRSEPSPNLAEWLNRRGFRSAAISTGFMGNLTRGRGLVRGFTDVIAPSPIDNDLQDDWTRDRAIEWLGRHGGVPFFLWVHLFGPHLDHRDHPGIGFSGYAGEVRFSDEQLGRILDALREIGAQQSTLVVVAADHGESLGEGGRYGHPPELNEELIHVPLVLSGPGVEPGTVNDVVSLTDLSSTVLGALRVERPPGMPARDLLRRLTRSQERVGGERPAFFSASAYDRPSVAPRWKFGMRLGSLKVVQDASTGAWGCWDVERDLNETTNVFDEPAFAEQCAARASWLLGFNQR